MSWKSILDNQTVSRANLQDAVNNFIFIVRNGVPATDTNKQVTKDNVENYINAWSLYPSFSNKTPNQLPFKSDINVQSNQIYAISDRSISIGNNNRNWVYSVYDALFQDEWGCVASSTNNRCILAGRSYTSGSRGGGVWLSNDYTETWRRVDEVMTNNDSCLSVAMNSYGDYMILTRQVGSFDGDRAKIYWSHDSGVTWSVGYNAAGVRYNFNGAAMNGDGVYSTVLGSDGTNYYVFRSTDFGESFTRTYLCLGIKTLITGCVGMSKSGQYQLLTPPEPTGVSLGYFYVSNNYGSSWTAVTIPDIPLAPNDVFKGCSVSAGGDYMTVVAYSLTLSQLRTYISSDFGINWTVIYGGDVAQTVDTSGKFQYQKGRASVDYGNSWGDGVITANAISVNSTTFTTPHIYLVSTSGNLYKYVTQVSSFSLIPISGYFTKVATSGGSYNGKYVAAIKNNDPGGFPNYNLYQSTDYGATWSTFLSSAGQTMKCCAVSDDGVYWLASTYDGPSNQSYIYISVNLGVTWQFITAASFEAQDCAISNDGKYMTIVVTEPGGGDQSVTILNSNNYGASWTGIGNYFGTGYVSIAMSGHGRYRSFVTSNSNGARVYYSGDYGLSYAEDFYIANYNATSCALDDSGVVGVASFVSFDNVTCRIYKTLDGWDTESFYTTNIGPAPQQQPNVSGVNISSDATYWLAASSNLPYGFRNSNGNNVWNVANQEGILFNSISK
jgi:hypothetical protein